MQPTNLFPIVNGTSFTTGSSVAANEAYINGEFYSDNVIVIAFTNETFDSIENTYFYAHTPEIKGFQIPSNYRFGHKQQMI